MLIKTRAMSRKEYVEDSKKSVFESTVQGKQSGEDLTLRADTDENIALVLLSIHINIMIVATNLADGYWVEAMDVDMDGWIDLVTSGLAVGDVYWYRNPHNEHDEWVRQHIIKLSKPVAIDHADIDNDGFPDIVISHNYGSCMYNCAPTDGKVSWLRNPGNSERGWEARLIGNIMAAHRVKIGKFTQNTNMEVMVLPVVGVEGVHEPVKVQIYNLPSQEDILKNDLWTIQPVDNTTFRIIHGVVVGKFGSRRGSDLDSVLLASEEGVTWLYYGGKEIGWKHENLNKGELSEYSLTKFKGSGNVDACRIGDDAFALIPTAEPFHGNTIAAYRKDTTNSLTDVRWDRQVLEVMGHPNSAGEGEAHHVVCADFDDDGNDEFLVALRGPMPYQGILHFTPLPVEEGVLPKYNYQKQSVSTNSAARIALADFNNDGKLDFATTGYYTPGYFLCDNPQVLVYYNNIEQQGKGLSESSVPAATSTCLGEEALPPAERVAKKSVYFPEGAVKVGIQPTGWVNDDFPLLGNDLYSYGQIMDEVALAGFEGGSVGHKYPTDRAVLKKELGLRNLVVSEPWTSTYFSVPGMANKTTDGFVTSMDFIRDMGGKSLVVAELGHAVHQLPLPLFANKPNFTEAQWQDVAAGLNSLGQLAKNAGMQLLYHHHLGSGVMYRDEIDKLMSLTDPELVYLLVDTGHAFAANVDPLDLIRTYKSRVREVHLKNVRYPRLLKVVQDGLTFYEGILEGMFTVPGDDSGVVDFEPILGELSDLKYSGWLVVEAEQDPSKGDPLQYAQTARAYLKQFDGL